MNQEILNKLHTALYTISPLASDRERIIGEMGETIWFESLEKILLSLPESSRTEMIDLLNSGELDKAVEILESNNVDIDVILTEVSTSVMEEVMSVAK